MIQNRAYTGVLQLKVTQGCRFITVCVLLCRKNQTPLLFLACDNSFAWFEFQNLNLGSDDDSHRDCDCWPLRNKKPPPMALLGLYRLVRTLGEKRRQ
jgi:hypothetical protein